MDRSSIEDAHGKAESILFSTEGFTFTRDAALGQQVSSMIERGVRIPTAEGFAFLEQNVMDNAEIIRDLELCLGCDSFLIGLYRTLGAVPGAYAFRRSNPLLPTESVLLHMLMKGSKVAIWKASHRVQVPHADGKIPLFEATDVDLRAAGLERIEETFETGGYLIRETRLFAEVLAAKAITLAIAKPGVKWPPLQVDKSLQPVVDRLKRKGSPFILNVTYT